MIYDLDTLENDFIYPMVKTIIELPEASEQQKSLAITESVIKIIKQDREARHASAQ